MNDIDKSYQIVEIISWYWKCQSEDIFRIYIKDAFDIDIIANPVLSGIFLVELNSYPEQYIKNSGEIIRKWLVDHSGICYNPPIKIPKFPNDPENLTNGFYKYPYFRFAVSGNLIDIRESFGPKKLCFKTGELIYLNEKWQIRNLRIEWSSK